MNWFKNKNTYKIFLFLYIFANTLSGCVPNINDNNIDNLTSQKTQIALLLPIGSSDRNLSYLGKSLRDAAFLAKEDLGNNSFYFKTGDWINHYSFLVFDGSEVLLKYFKKKN